MLTKFHQYSGSKAKKFLRKSTPKGSWFWRKGFASLEYRTKPLWVSEGDRCPGGMENLLGKGRLSTKQSSKKGVCGKKVLLEIVETR